MGLLIFIIIGIALVTLVAVAAKPPNTDRRRMPR
jgi:hypothetical protein